MYVGHMENPMGTDFTVHSPKGTFGFNDRALAVRCAIRTGGTITQFVFGQHVEFEWTAS